MDLFIPKTKESAVDIVINNIKRLLLKKKLLPGDRLPNELELSKALSVSRGSVREAMKILSAFGIVEVKQGDGTYISESVGHVLFDPLLFSLILSQPDIRELTEFRQLMEVDIVELIIKNADESDIKELMDIHSEMEQRVEDNTFDSSALSDLDVRFHRAMGRATKNKLIEKVYASIIDFLAPSIEKTHENQSRGVHALTTHKGILDAITERDLNKAVKAIEESVLVWKNLQLID